MLAPPVNSKHKCRMFYILLNNYTSEIKNHETDQCLVYHWADHNNLSYNYKAIMGYHSNDH